MTRRTEYFLDSLIVLAGIFLIITLLHSGNFLRFFLDSISQPRTDFSAIVEEKVLEEKMLEDISDGKEGVWNSPTSFTPDSTTCLIEGIQYQGTKTCKDRIEEALSND